MEDTVEFSISPIFDKKKEKGHAFPFHNICSFFFMTLKNNNFNLSSHKRIPFYLIFNPNS